MTIDLSRERRRWAVRVLRSRKDSLRGLNGRERLTFALGLLMTDRGGTFSEADVAAAAADPSALQVASVLLIKAGCARPGEA